MGMDSKIMLVDDAAFMRMTIKTPDKSGVYKFD